MSDFIVNPKSVSFKEIRTNLMDYVKAQPDSAQWSLFLESSAGSNMIDLISGIAAFAKMEAITARRESFTQHAQNRSSVVGGAQGLGYSAYRGRNKVLKITIVPATTEVIPKFTYVGAVRDRYLVVEEDTVVNAGVPVTFNVIVGEVLEESKVAPNTALNNFRFTKSGVSEDLRIYIDDKEVEWSDSVEQMLLGKFAIQSNPYGSIDAKYFNLGTFLTRYMAGSIVKLQWVSLKDVDFQDTEIALYEEYGTLQSIETLSVFEDVEDKNSIQINAPLKRETSNAVRGREDQPKIFRTLHPDIMDAKGEDVSDAIMKILLLRRDGFTFTPAEKTEMQNRFEGKRPHGLLPPIIEDAEPSYLKLDIDIILKSKSTTLAQQLVDGILSQYQNKLETKISLYDIEQQIEEDAGVKIARVKIDGDDWMSTKLYRLGEYAKKPSDNGLIYRVIGFKHYSSDTEPVWPTVAKLTVKDFEIIWKAVPKSDLAGFEAWEDGKVYQVGSEVKPTVDNGFIYQCVEVLNHSDAIEPTWPEVAGQEVYDGRLIWKARLIEGTVPVWQASHVYRKGDVVKKTVGTSTLMYQCVGYLGVSGVSQPTWNTSLEASFDDNQITWFVQSPTQDVHTVPKNQYFVLSSTPTVS